METLKKSKRIFVIADFKDEEPKSIRIQPRMWVKGLIRLGHDVHRFSYRNIMTQFNPFSGVHFRRFAPRFVRKRADRLLCKQIKSYHPDIVLLLSMKYLTDETIRDVKEIAPQTVFVGRDEDPFPEKNSQRLAIAQDCDIIITTSAGRFLQTYKNAGVKKCAFLPNFCDPDIQYKYDINDAYRANIIFTGKPTHYRIGQIGDRYHLIEKISKMRNCCVYGAFGSPRVEGIDYYCALSNAKIVLSINIVNDVPLYHSDRLINCLACGAFTLAKRVPDTELLFEDGKHLRYFDTVEEFFELANWYLKHDDEREKIAQAGMEFAHKEYNCARMANYVIDLVETGDYDAKWKVIL